MCALHFFLGANTPQGFISRFDQLADPTQGWHEINLKGGPGTGKSTIMRHFGEALQSPDAPTEWIHCSSDAYSLDGVLLHGAKIAIADGTPPHVLEPKYPGAFEHLINLSACWDPHTLYIHRQEIMTLAAKISRCHEHCCRFLSAASSLLSDTYRLAMDTVFVPKLQKAANRLADNMLPKGTGTPGKESVRFLSAVTNLGFLQFQETAQTLCDRLYCIEDAHGAVSRLFLNVLRSRALESGLDIISCYCPLAPFEKLEHFFIPSLKIGFMTVNDYHKQAAVPEKIIRARRFMDAQGLSAARGRIAFNRKAAAQMLEQAARLLADAKAMHDQLEGYYVRAMDFEKVSELEKTLIESVRAGLKG